MRRRTFLLSASAAVLTWQRGARCERADRPGLTVRNGALLRKGRPFRGIGANYFNVFHRLLRDPNDKTGAEGLKRLGGAGLPFVRFSASGFWPSDWGLYRTDPADHFRRLDAVVRAAETSQVGLVPSLFWYFAAVPDLVGEPMDQIGNAKNKTSAFIEKYTDEVVRRYQGTDAIWGWEMGNEYSLGADLPNAAQHRPKVIPHLKTAGQRSERDELRSEHLTVAFQTFSRSVRAIDPSRPIFTGNSIPRASAWHNTHERSWKADSPEQFEEVLLRDNPSPIDTITVHVYPDAKGAYPAGAKTTSEVIGAVQRISRKAKKPLFLGEFGAPRSLGREQAKTAFTEMLTAIEAHRVPLSAFWVFDLPSQDQDWNITFDNDRAELIDLAVAANQRLARAHD